MPTKTATNSRPKAKPPESLPLMFTVPPGSAGFLSKYQIAALLSIGQSLFKQMVARGEYPKPDTRLGKLPRWSVDTHNAWVAARCAKARG